MGCAINQVSWTSFALSRSLEAFKPTPAYATMHKKEEVQLS